MSTAFKSLLIGIASMAGANGFAQNNNNDTLTRSQQRAIRAHETIAPLNKQIRFYTDTKQDKETVDKAIIEVARLDSIAEEIEWQKEELTETAGNKSKKAIKALENQLDQLLDKKIECLSNTAILVQSTIPTIKNEDAFMGRNR